MADLDIKRLIFERPELKDKCFFVLGDEPAPAAVSRAKRFGTILKMNSDNVAEKLAAKSKIHVPIVESGPIPYCLERFEVSSNPAPFPDRLVFDLMLWGQVKSEFVWKSLHGGPRYVVKRQAAVAAIGRIQAGVTALVVHSDLGNGKSILLEEIKCRAKELHYAVYTFRRSGGSLREEMEWALRSEEPTLFIFDNYPDWLDELKLYPRLAGHRSAIVLAGRTSAHDVLVQRLSQNLEINSVEEIPVGKLAAAEIESIIDYFDEYGLWGDLAGWSRLAKSDYLVRVCHSQWHAILIRLLESPQIQSKLEQVFDSLRKQKNYYQALIAILVFAVLGRNPSFDDLVDYCGQPVLEGSFRRDPAIREVIDFTAGEVRLRSSTTGQFILKRVVDPNATTEVLMSIARTADRLASVSGQAFDLLKSLSRFSNLQSVLPEKGKSGAILRFYESCKGLSHCKGNPLFWLQYAIACTVLEEFVRAQKYFDTSYSLADKRETYDSYQIDNHYARFKIMRAIHSQDAAGSMPAFREARNIIFSQIQNERLHYPYRVATAFGQFYDDLAAYLKDEDKNEIKRAAKHISDRISSLPDARRQHRTVDECWREMQRILNSK